MSTPIAERIKPFLEALILRSRGLVLGVRSSGLPPLLNAPIVVELFGGAVNLGDVHAPVQLRIAYDATGALVNSWIETTTGRSIATPISGRALCLAGERCTVTGDGLLMGQAWNPDPGEEPEFRTEFGWSGLRYFELKTEGDVGTARIWDPKVVITGGNGEMMEEFLFELRRTPELRF